jgi:hypothetical protein
LSACRPTLNLGGQSTIFITPWAGCPSYTPRHLLHFSVAFYELHGLHWDCSFPRSPHEGYIYIYRLANRINCHALMSRWRHEVNFFWQLWNMTICSSLGSWNGLQNPVQDLTA